jgi:hypothetical protein
MVMKSKKNDRSADPSGGEGNIAADRRYREGVERSVREGDTEELAKEAADALDGPEGASLRAAEEAAKRGKAKGDVSADLGYGKSHGYGPSHGGPTGPGDAPAKPPERHAHR